MRCCVILAMALWIGGCAAPQGVTTATSLTIPKPETWPPERAAAALTARLAECRPPSRPTIGTLCAMSSELVRLRQRIDCARARTAGGSIPSDCASY